MTETRYLVPAGTGWAAWDDVNGVLAFMTDAEVIANARENERELWDEDICPPLPADPSPEECWSFVNAIWSGDPGGRSWQERIPEGATWVSLRSDDGDADRVGPAPTFGFGEPPTDEGLWREPGY